MEDLRRVQSLLSYITNFYFQFEYVAMKLLDSFNILKFLVQKFLDAKPSSGAMLMLE